AKVFFRNELAPLQSKILQINDWLGEEVIKFDKYTLDDE
ncbi:TPA: capsid portal protein, partial [Proteus mirabilis]|nr:capsid portal protein [Proteus mirabilis]HEK0627957.1 capsid portal protein [Proteus mirabilis]